MSAVTEFSPAIELVQLGDATSETTWLVSDWNAGQSSIMQWSPDNVRVAEDGSIEFILSASPDGAARPYQGGEIQSSANASTGTWSWLSQAPEMVDGAVYGMFLYKSNWQKDPVLEFDFEFVGASTTTLEINIHMQDAAGKYITLAGGPLVIDLGFDAAKGQHLYEIELTGTSAIFRIDGVVVADLNASHMPGNTWYTGNVKGFVDLWAVAPAQEQWAGKWDYDGTPLVATVAGIGHPGDPLVLEAPVVQPEPTPAPVPAPEEPEEPEEVEVPVEPAPEPTPVEPEPAPVEPVPVEPVPEPVDPAPLEPVPVEPEPEPVELEPVEPTPEPEPAPAPKGNNGKGSGSENGKGNTKKTADLSVASVEDDASGPGKGAQMKALNANINGKADADSFIFVKTAASTTSEPAELMNSTAGFEWDNLPAEPATWSTDYAVLDIITGPDETDFMI
jgi:hypothetical protein